MKHLVGVALLLLASPAPAQAAAGTGLYCGAGMASRAEMARLAGQLKKAIDDGYRIYRHPALFGDNFSIGDRDRLLYVPARDLVNFRRQLSRRQDWDFIHKSLVDGHLASGGWRGCFVDDGKIFFEADKRGRLTISVFDADRQWSWLRKPARKR